MSTDNKDQMVDQLLRGVYRLCVNKDDCSNCPFYVTKCTFGEPKPRTWFDEETITIKAAPEIENVLGKEGIIYVHPFLQCSKGGVVFSPFTVSVKGISSGFLDRKQSQIQLSWKVCTPSGSLAAGKEQSGKQGNLRNSGN